MAFRRGRVVTKVDSRAKLDTMQGAGWAKQAIDDERPAKMFIDVGGVGAGVYDRLVEMGYGEIVRPVNFGSAPFEPQKLDKYGKPQGGPVNRRAEMWMKSKEWLADPAGVLARARGKGLSVDGDRIRLLGAELTIEAL